MERQTFKSIVQEILQCDKTKSCERQSHPLLPSIINAGVSAGTIVSAELGNVQSCLCRGKRFTKLTDIVQFKAVVVSNEVQLLRYCT